MSNLLTVQDPDESAVEQAVETRRLLQIWADKHLPSGPQVEIQPVSDERIKLLRTEGADLLDVADQHQKGLRNSDPTSEFGRLLGQYLFAVRRGAELHPRDTDPREHSYVLEGVAKEFQKRFFQAGMKWNTHAEWMAAASSTYPSYTSGYQDQVMYKVLGTENTACAHLYMLGFDMVQPRGVYAPDMYRTRMDTTARFAGITTWLAGLSGADLNARDTSWWANTLGGFDRVGLQVHYMEADGPWVAGFLTLDDACRLRFRRVRLGAYLAEQGLSDASVRQYVESAKQQVAGAEFIAYPNDVEWEQAYTSGPGSCMADSASDYNTWDDIHPVSTYSSALHGCGDNSLVLLTSVENGDITGRGILNLQTDSIVRWYGDNQAERVLKRSGVNTYNSEALADSWLAHLSQGQRFIHPYVDGALGCGVIEDGRVYLRDDGICIQETGGSSYQGTAYYCEDTELEVGEDDCTYQEITETYISNDCDSWRCPIIDEWVSPYSRTEIMLHGVFAEVSEHAWYRIGRYCTNMNGGRSKSDTNYSIDDDGMREAFMDYYDIEEQDEDDESDEEAA